MQLFKLFGTVAINNAEANEAIQETTSQAQDSSTKIGSAFGKIGAIVASAFAAEKIIDFGKACIEAAAEASAMESQFTQVFGTLEKQATKDLKTIAKNTGVLENRMKGSYTKIAAFAKTSGMDTADSLELANRSMLAIADSAAFYDRTLEETTESLQSFLKGNYENDSALGLSCTETTRNAAANKLYGKSFKDLSEAQKQLTLLQMVEDANKTSGALGQAARESDTWTNQIGNLTQAWTDFKATIGGLFLESATGVVGDLADVVAKLNVKLKEAIEWVKNNQETVEQWKAVLIATTASIGTFLIAVNWGSIMTAAANAVNVVRTAIAGLNATIKSNPIVLVISLIVGLISYFAYMYKTSEKFRNQVQGIYKEIKKYVEILLPYVKKAIEVISETISDVVAFLQPIIKDVFEWLKSVFTDSSGNASEFVKKLKAFFKDAWETIKTIWGYAVEFFTMIWENVISPVADLVGEMIGAFQEAWNVIKLVWEQVAPYFEMIWEILKVKIGTIIDLIVIYFKTAWEVLKIVWDMAVPYFKTIWEAIKGTFSVVATWLGGFFKTAWEVIKAVWNVVIDYFTMIWAGIKAVFAVVGAVLSGDFSNAWEAIKNLWNRAKEFFASVWEGIKGVFGSVADWFGSVFSKAWEAVKAVFSKGGKIFDGIKEGIASLFSTIVNGLISGINKITALPFKTINKMLNAIRDVGVMDMKPFKGLWDKDPIDIPEIPMLELAKGGVVDKATPAIFGEDGAEAVVPLERNTQWIQRVAEQLNGSMNQNAVDMILAKLDALLKAISQLAGLQIVLDNGVLVGELAPNIDSQLGILANYKERGG